MGPHDPFIAGGWFSDQQQIAWPMLIYSAQPVKNTWLTTSLSHRETVVFAFHLAHCLNHGFSQINGFHRLFLDFAFFFL